MKRLLLTCIVVLCNILFTFAQSYSIKGVVLDSNSLEPISGVNVIIKHTTNNKIVKYAVTDDAGTFSMVLSTDKPSEYSLQVSCLGYEQEFFSLSNDYYSIKLKEKAFEIQAASLKVDKIVENQDTTSYYVAAFASQKDRTIGEVLSNMPGISVANDGKISFNGRNIDRLYIEGIDLFQGRYNLATSNISHENISRVDVIENHQPIKALKGKGVDTETAINLKLKEEAKSVWSGNIQVEGGFSPDEALWESGLFAARFSAQSQSATTLKSNNSGKDIANEGNYLTIDDLLYAYPDSEISGNLTSSPSISTNLDNDRTRFNTTHMFSNSSMWKLSEDAQLKSQIIYTDDNNSYNQSITSSYFLLDSLLLKSTNEISEVKDKTLQATVVATIDKENYFLSDDLSFKSNWRSYVSDISGDFNYHSIADIDTWTLKNKLKYINTSGKNVFQIVSINNFMYIPEKLNVSGEEDKEQTINKSNFFSNTNFRFTRKIRRWSLGMNFDIFGNIYNFSSLYDDTITEYRNQLNINYFGAQFNPEFLYQNQTLRLNITFPVSAYHFEGYESKTKLFILPDIHLRWQFLPRWKFSANASYGNSYSGNSLFYTAPIMINYNAMYAGFLNYDGRIQKRIGVSLSYSNPADMLFAHMSFIFSDQNTNRSISKEIDDGYLYYSYQSGNDSYKMLFSNVSISKGIDAINGTVEFRGSLMNNNMPIVLNSLSSSYDAGNINGEISLKSNPVSWFDLDYKLGYRYNYLDSEISNNSTQYITQKCLLAFYPTEDISLKFNAEHYLTIFYTTDRKNAFFADLEFVYRFKQFDFTATASNLFNQSLYSYTIYGDLSGTETEYNIRPRNILIGLTWYF